MNITYTKNKKLACVKASKVSSDRDRRRRLFYRARRPSVTCVGAPAASPSLPDPQTTRHRASQCHSATTVQRNASDCNFTDRGRFRRCEGRHTNSPGSLPTLRRDSYTETGETAYFAAQTYSSTQKWTQDSLSNWSEYCDPSFAL